jgi:heterogeneous nuclear ribonucleoprotein A1/A3
MLNKIMTLTTVTALAILLMPSKVDAWGAAHVGYTHFGPNGVYHTGRTVAAGPGGAYAGGRTGAYGAYGGAYRTGYGGAVGYGGAAGYHYSAGYAGGAAYGAARYGYIR